MQDRGRSTAEQYLRRGTPLPDWLRRFLQLNHIPIDAQQQKQQQQQPQAHVQIVEPPNNVVTLVEAEGEHVGDRVRFRNVCNLDFDS